MLPWTPAFFIGMIGVLLLWTRQRWLAACLVLAMLAYTWYNASIPNWHGSGAFGLRRLTLLAPWFAIGLSLLYARLERWHPLIPSTLTMLLATWTTLLLVRYHMYMIPHDIARLYAMPDMAFYFSRDALPVGTLPVLLFDSYFWQTLTTQPFTATRIAETGLVAILAGFAVWGIFRLSGKLRPLPAVHTVRRAGIHVEQAQADIQPMEQSQA
jgi:hypothetical protein